MCVFLTLVILINYHHYDVNVSFMSNSSNCLDIKYKIIISISYDFLKKKNFYIIVFYLPLYPSKEIWIIYDSLFKIRDAYGFVDLWNSFVFSMLLRSITLYEEWLKSITCCYCYFSIFQLFFRKIVLAKMWFETTLLRVCLESAYFTEIKNFLLKIL